MPNYEVAFPVGATQTRAVYNKVSYPIDVSLLSNRAGEDGNVPVFHYFGSTYFAGEILEGQWRKWWDDEIIGPFTALISSGEVQLTGEAAVAGNYDDGAIRSINPVLMVDDTVIDIHVKAPSLTAANDVWFHALLRSTLVTAKPTTGGTFLDFILIVNSSNYKIQVRKFVNGSGSNLISATNIINAEGTFRIKMQQNGSGHTHIYFHDGSGDVDESADEIAGSPFTDAYLPTIAYPYIHFETSEDTVRTFSSESIKVTYPDDIQFESTVSDADKNLGDVELWDGVPGVVGSKRVMDANHEFNNDPYIQNSLIRLQIAEGLVRGLKFSSYFGSSWNQPLNVIEFTGTGTGFTYEYAFFQSIESVTPDEVKIKIMLKDSDVDDSNAFVSLYATIKRGLIALELEFIEIFPKADSIFYFYNTSVGRFGYSGDGEIADSVLASQAFNSTLSDNFLLGFDPAGSLSINTMSTNIKPGAASELFWARRGNSLRLTDILASDFASTKVWLTYHSFPLVANLFVEAEDATISAAARLNLDGDGEDTVTEGEAVWTTFNCTVDVNDATDPQVGAKDVEITSDGAGAVRFTCTPGTPLAIIKFDSLKFWVRKTNGSDFNFNIRINDDDGDYVQKSFPLTGSMVQIDIDLPHSSTDLQGWTENGTFRFTDPYATIVIRAWEADGAGEIVLIDGMHFYIGTTTTRGRGETLSGGEAVVLDINPEYVRNSYTVLSALPAGKYLSITRGKDTDQVASDFRFYQYNLTETDYVNEAHANNIETLTGSFVYYIEVFDIAEGYDGDTIYHQSEKETATENTIFVDYQLIIPLSNGKDWPMDIAHNALRTLGLQKDVQITDG